LDGDGLKEEEVVEAEGAVEATVQVDTVPAPSISPTETDKSVDSVMISFFH